MQLKGRLPTIWAYLQVIATVNSFPLARQEPHPAQTPVVHLRNGTLAGVYHPEYRQDFFLGIPFAEAPVGNRRFQKPVPPEAWNGVRTADTYGPSCFGNSLGLQGFSQNDTGDMSENCLYINVIRPADSPPIGKLPVLAWIYGGDWEEGSASDQRYNGSFLVQTSVKMGSPVIFVSFNYRLGLFGLLAGRTVEQEGLTNLLLYDQRQALKWVQENIGDFGGDATRVTLMGESSGAGSIGFHLLAYGGHDDGLFHAAIAESGGPFSAYAFPNASQREEKFETLLNITGCAKATDSLDCLRTIPAELVNRASLQVQFYFTVDGDLLPDRNSRLLQSGKFLKVPLIIGINRNEGTSMILSSMPSPINSDVDFLNFMKGAIGDYPVPESVLRNWTTFYQEEIDNPSVAGLGTVLADPGPNFDSQYGKTTLWFGDLLLGAGRRFTSQIWADNDVPCYSYFFDTVPASLDAETLGVAHAQEIPFVFGNKDGVGWDVDPFPADPGMKAKYNTIANLMSRMWISFAVRKSPNYNGGKCMLRLLVVYNLAFVSLPRFLHLIQVYYKTTQGSVLC